MPERDVSVLGSHNQGDATTSASASSRMQHHDRVGEPTFTAAPRGQLVLS